MPDETSFSIPRPFPAIVVQVVDDRTVVINRGSHDGIQSGQRFLVYALSPDALIDPETGESLGRLELVRGRGKVVHLQEKLSTIKADSSGAVERRVITRKNPFLFGTEEETVISPAYSEGFERVSTGDLAKPI